MVWIFRDLTFNNSRVTGRIEVGKTEQILSSVSKPTVSGLESTNPLRLQNVCDFFTFFWFWGPIELFLSSFFSNARKQLKYNFHRSVILKIILVADRNYGLLLPFITHCCDATVI